MSKLPRIVITGGTGFIGSSLIERLSRSGYSIVSLERSPARSMKSVRRVAIDLTDYAALSRLIKKDDVVVHLACSSIPKTAEDHRADDVRENLFPTLTLLDACVKKGARKFLFASSGGMVYGGSYARPIRESDPPEPMSSYGALKLSIENYLGVYVRRYQLPTVILRIANVYGRIGTKRPTRGAVEAFLYAALHNEPAQRLGDPVRDYVHIDDVVSFIEQAVRSSRIEGVYNVGTGVGTSLTQLADIIRKVTHRRLLLNASAAPAADVPYAVVNIRKALATGWKPTYTLQKGILALLEK